MLSSISNSSDRAPDAPWWRLWGLALVVVVIGLLVIEAFWRQRGWQPSVVDNQALWADKRGDVYASEPGQPVVLAGASRMQFDFSRQAFQRMEPDLSLVNLSLAGSCALAVLRDLAADENFRGIVLISITSDCFTTYSQDEQQSYVDYYHDRNLNTQLNAWIRAEVQSRVVMIDPALKLITLVENALWQKPLPRPNYYVMDTERQIDADYRLTHAEKHREGRVNKAKFRRNEIPAMAPREWLREAQATTAWVKAIQQRGGTVVFIRMPSSDEHWLVDQSWYPRQVYWDALMALSPAQSIHFADIAPMLDLELPDASHLDRKDKDRFTRLLLEALQKRGVLPRA